MADKIEMKAMFNLSYGLYVVTTAAEDKLNGQVANAVMQITGDPICVTVCLNKANLTTELIKKAGFFGVSVLEQEVPMTFIGQFGFKSGRDIDKFEGVNYKIGETGAPMVEDYSLSVFEAKVTEELDIETHTLFVGEVVTARALKEATPLTYADYHLIKKGKSPKTAPTFGFNALK